MYMEKKSYGSGVCKIFWKTGLLFCRKNSESTRSMPRTKKNEKPKIRTNFVALKLRYIVFFLYLSLKKLSAYT